MAPIYEMTREEILEAYEDQQEDYEDRIAVLELEKRNDSLKIANLEAENKRLKERVKDLNEKLEEIKPTQKTTLIENRSTKECSAHNKEFLIEFDKMQKRHAIMRNEKDKEIEKLIKLKSRLMQEVFSPNGGIIAGISGATSSRAPGMPFGMDSNSPNNIHQNVHQLEGQPSTIVSPTSMSLANLSSAGRVTPSPRDALSREDAPLCTFFTSSKDMSGNMTSRGPPPFRDVSPKSSSKPSNFKSPSNMNNMDPTNMDWKSQFELLQNKHNALQKKFESLEEELEYSTKSDGNGGSGGNRGSKRRKKS